MGELLQRDVSTEWTIHSTYLVPGNSRLRVRIWLLCPNLIHKQLLTFNSVQLILSIFILFFLNFNLLVIIIIFVYCHWVVKPQPNSKSISLGIVFMNFIILVHVALHLSKFYLKNTTRCSFICLFPGQPGQTGTRKVNHSRF